MSYREEEEAEAEAEKGLEYRESNTLEEDILVAVVETWGKKETGLLVRGVLRGPTTRLELRERGVKNQGGLAVEERGKKKLLLSTTPILPLFSLPVISRGDFRSRSGGGRDWVPPPSLPFLLAFFFALLARTEIGKKKGGGRKEEAKNRGL